MFKTIKFTKEDEEYVEKEMKFLSDVNPEHYRSSGLSLPKFNGLEHFIPHLKKC